jgi:hypothetical protein
MQGLSIKDGSSGGLEKVIGAVADLMEKYAPESYKDVLTKALSS